MNDSTSATTWVDQGTTLVRTMETFGDIGTLQNDDLANYRWGRYAISLSSAAVSERRYLIDAIVGLQQGVGVWDNEAEFKSFVSLFHEFVHYQQDIASGVGHWDYVERDRFKRGGLAHLLYQSYMGDTDEIRAEKQLKLAQFAERSVFNAYGLRHESAIGSLGQEFREFENYSTGDESKFTILNVLEFDAAFSVYASVSGLRASAERVQIAEKFQGIVDPYLMDGVYRDLYFEFLALGFSATGSIDGEAGERSDGWFTFLNNTVPIFIDIALAYPPPTFFEKNPDARPHFEPGLRLIRIVHSFQTGEATGEEITHLSLGQLSLVKYIDEKTRATDRFVYPPVSEIYAEWIDYFKEHTTDDPIADWRLDLCERRLADPDSFARRSVFNIFNHDLPVFVQLPGNLDDFVHMTNRLLGSKGPDLYWQIQANNRDLALLDLHFGLGNSLYTCPLASKSSAGKCLAQERRCTNGIKAIDQLPLSPDCVVRSSLEEAGFNLGRLAE